MNRRTRQLIAADRFRQLAPNDRRQMREVWRRIVAGSPVEAAMECITGSREAPKAWTP